MTYKAIILLLFPASLLAETIIPPSNLFRDPKFVREFVGSYGFLSDVEPRVSPDEQAALAIIRDLFDQSKFREAEQTLTRFVQETEKPTDSKKVAAEIRLLPFVEKKCGRRRERLPPSLSLGCVLTRLETRFSAITDGTREVSRGSKSHRHLD